MRILASVYACSPYDGSERAVGWNWVKELDKYHQITALTSHVYKSAIEHYIAMNPGELTNTQFIYIDVPHTSWHKGYRLERIYYILWQKQAEKVAKKLVNENKYDLVHHITYVTCVLPTYMHNLNIPFLLGPVAGGDLIPSVMQYPLSRRDALFETIRHFSQIIFTASPNFKKTIKKATLILAATEETARLIPDKHKVQIFQAIGVKDDYFIPKPLKKDHRKVRFLMVGRMMYSKGYDLGIQAFFRALDDGMEAELTILGDTENDPKKESYRKNIEQMCIDRKEVTFVDKINFSKMKEFYDNFDVVINCTLRDSGCFVVMEAMCRGIPVIVLNTGGPKINTTSETAIKIEPAPMEIMIHKMSVAIKELAEDSSKRTEMGSAARSYAQQHFSMSERTKQMNAFYEKVVKDNLT